MNVPDTKLVGEALALARHALPEPILDHSLRAFLLASAYATATKRDHDAEDLCLAAIFHDLGLAPGKRRPGEAFTRAGSRALATFLEERDVSPERAAPLGDAIDFHMQLFPRWSKGNVVGLLQVGAWMDVMGLRRGTVRAEAKRIDAELPKTGFTSAFYGRLFATIRSPSACLDLLFVPARG